MFVPFCVRTASSVSKDDTKRSRSTNTEAEKRVIRLFHVSMISSNRTDFHSVCWCQVVTKRWRTVTHTKAEIQFPNLPILDWWLVTGVWIFSFIDIIGPLWTEIFYSIRHNSITRIIIIFVSKTMVFLVCSEVRVDWATNELGWLSSTDGINGWIYCRLSHCARGFCSAILFNWLVHLVFHYWFGSNTFVALPYIFVTLALSWIAQVIDNKQNDGRQDVWMSIDATFIFPIFRRQKWW